MAKTLATSLLPAFILILPTGAQAADALLCGRVNGAERTSAHVVVYSAVPVTGEDRSRLTLGRTVFIAKGRVEPAAVGERVAELMASRHHHLGGIPS